MVKYFVNGPFVNSDFFRKDLSNQFKLNVYCSWGEGFGAY